MSSFRLGKFLSIYVVFYEFSFSVPNKTIKWLFFVESFNEDSNELIRFWIFSLLNLLCILAIISTLS